MVSNFFAFAFLPQICDILAKLDENFYNSFYVSSTLFDDQNNFFSYYFRLHFGAGFFLRLKSLWLIKFRTHRSSKCFEYLVRLWWKNNSFKKKFKEIKIFSSSHFFWWCRFSLQCCLQHVQSKIYFYQFLHFPEAHGYDLDYAWYIISLRLLRSSSLMKVCSYSIKNTRKKKTFWRGGKRKKIRKTLKNLSHISSRTRLIKNIFEDMHTPKKNGI